MSQTREVSEAQRIWDEAQEKIVRRCPTCGRNRALRNDGSCRWKMTASFSCRPKAAGSDGTS